MIIKSNKYLSLFIWIALITIFGSIIGSLTKPEISEWYSYLNRSDLTPPNYVFPIVWTFLYGLIGACGWIIWQEFRLQHLYLIKTLYIVHLILNWSWTPLFFRCHLIGTSLIVLTLINIIISMIIYFAYPRIRSVSILMIPYLFWTLFASYLNLYIWQHN